MYLQNDPQPLYLPPILGVCPKAHNRLKCCIEVNDIHMILPVHQNPADLALAVIAGKVQAPLTVLKHAALNVGDWTLTFHIIGESHLVTLEHDGEVMLSELLACVEVDAETCVHHHRFGDLGAHCFEQAGYSVTVNFDNEYVAQSDETENMLEVAFPEIAGETPVTRVIWERVGENAVCWQTLHVYPHEGKIIGVRSLSYFNSLVYNRAL